MIVCQKGHSHKRPAHYPGAIFIGPGMADFCLRIVDNNGKPINNFTITSLMKKQK